MRITKLVLDYSKWRCGRDSINQLGIGQTYLKNSDGFMCCLGQWCEQAGVPEVQLIRITTPAYLKHFVPLFNRIDNEFNEINTELSIKAMKINDTTDTTPEYKIQALKELLLENGIELEVINKPEINLQN